MAQDQTILSSFSWGLEGFTLLCQQVGIPSEALALRTPNIRAPGVTIRSPSCVRRSKRPQAPFGKDIPDSFYVAVA